MSTAFFADVSDALRGFLSRDLRAFRSRAGSRNLKIWYGEDTHEHYEVQRISATVLKRGRRSGLEIGFHAEHPVRARNEEVLAAIEGATASLQCETGAFLGRPSPWMRASEVWDDHIDEPETAIEAAERLAEYIRAIEPMRRTR